MTPRQFKSFRKWKGLTQEDVCSMAGLSRQTVIWFEQGSRASTKTHDKLQQLVLDAGFSFSKNGRLILPE